jgi:YidC/Oxa1 family membrane protein insertase
MLRSQKQMQEIQPKLKEIQEKFKDDKQAQSQAMLQLYREHNYNPFSGCLPLLVQIPILLAVYRVLINGFQPETLDLLYSFVARPEAINSITMGFLDLSLKNPLLAIISGGLQFIQMRKTSPKRADTGSDQAAMMTRQMLYFFPIMIIVIAWNLPAGLVLYWTTTTLFSIFEQTLVFKNARKQ